MSKENPKINLKYMWKILNIVPIANLSLDQLRVLKDYEQKQMEGFRNPLKKPISKVSNKDTIV